MPGQITCGACGNLFPASDAAQLHDKNKHSWQICPLCVTALWNLQRPPLEPISPENEKAIMELATIAGTMQAVLDMMNRPTTEINHSSIRITIEAALKRARAVYS